MVKYEQYKQDGKKYYHIKGYLGVDPTGKQVNINKKGFKTKKEAELFYSKAQVELNNNQYVKKDTSLTYTDVYNEWILVYQNKVKESSFVKTKQIYRDHILPVFGNMKISKISHKVIQEQVNEWHKQFKQYKKVYNYLKRLFDYAMLHGYIQVNPCNRVSVPTKKLDYGGKKTSKDFYTKDELKQFLEALNDYDYPMWQCFYYLLAYTGIRRGEALGLTWNDIDFKNKLLNINKTLTEGEERTLIVQSPKSESAVRTIILDDTPLSILKKWKKEQAKLLIGFGYNAMSKDQLLFSKLTTNQHLNLSTPRNRLVNICKQFDLPMINIHGFRHTHASLLFEAGVSMNDVKERLGHSDITMTMNVYTHVTKDSKNKSAELFSNYINL